ncbi:hypothetical protein [uncultured Treponema sp.]|uniref:hypothetical protein n=1 Tax=uncultured Treponema sp. TaxID=162155 RepID=UPI00260056D4|nr:hypothetical protein [uncultured Treponema sp.]
MYITNSLLTEFDQELHDRCTMEYGYEQGVAEGAQQTAIANAINFLKMQILTPEQIAQGTGLRLDQVLNLEKELLQA